MRNSRTAAAAGARRRVAACGALAGVAGAVGLMATPGIAAAATTSPAAGVTPFVDCVTRSADRDHVDVIMGYRNPTGRTTSIPYGPGNHLDPRPAEHPQPATFRPGVHHGVFALRIDDGGPTLSWTLGGRHLVVDPAAATACFAGGGAGSRAAPNQDSGPVLGLIATGVVGAVLRRAARSPARWLRLTTAGRSRTPASGGAHGRSPTGDAPQAGTRAERSL